jgi:WD40 repeat protein
LAIAYGDGSTKLMNLEQGSALILKKDAVPITSINFSPSEKFLLTGSENGTVRLWDRGGTLRWEFQDHPQAIAGLTFSPHRDNILVIYKDGKIEYRPFKEEIRLSQLLRQGCLWLKDYLDTHPRARDTLRICALQ